MNFLIHPRPNKFRSLYWRSGTCAIFLKANAMLTGYPPGVAGQSVAQNPGVGWGTFRKAARQLGSSTVDDDPSGYEDCNTMHLAFS